MPFFFSLLSTLPSLFLSYFFPSSHPLPPVSQVRFPSMYASPRSIPSLPPIFLLSSCRYFFPPLAFSFPSLKFGCYLYPSFLLCCNLSRDFPSSFPCFPFFLPFSTHSCFHFVFSFFSFSGPSYLHAQLLFAVFTCYHKAWCEGFGSLSVEATDRNC